MKWHTLLKCYHFSFGMLVGASSDVISVSLLKVLVSITGGSDGVYVTSNG